MGVRFGKGARSSYVRNLQSGQVIYLRKERGVYVMDVEFWDGDKRVKGEIIVDSGAAENVMPRHWFAGDRWRKSLASRSKARFSFLVLCVPPVRLSEGHHTVFIAASIAAFLLRRKEKNNRK